MASTILQQQTPGQAAAKLPNGGGGDDNDPNRNKQQPGRAHYATDAQIATWRAIFNKQAGSAGMKSKHQRCVRCGNPVSE